MIHTTTNAAPPPTPPPPPHPPLPFFFLGALRPRRRDGLLGTGAEWEGDDRVKARPRKPPEKDRRDRGPPPEQWKCWGGVPSPLPSDLCTAQLLFQLLCLGRSSHKDNVRCTAVDEQLGQLEASRSPTFAAQFHLPTHDLFWANLKVQLHLPPLRSLDLLISPGTLSKK